MMEFMKSLSVAASGLKAQTGRMRVIAENIANAESTAATPDADPYRRRIPTFRAALDREMDVQMVKMDRVREDRSDFRLIHEPGHPAANAEGYVKRRTLTRSSRPWTCAKRRGATRPTSM